jgi:hypothetical protein
MVNETVEEPEPEQPRIRELHLNPRPRAVEPPPRSSRVGSAPGPVQTKRPASTPKRKTNVMNPAPRSRVVPLGPFDPDIRSFTEDEVIAIEQQGGGGYFLELHKVQLSTGEFLGLVWCAARNALWYSQGGDGQPFSSLTEAVQDLAKRRMPQLEG